MGNLRPPSRYGANSLSVKLSMLISAVCLIAGVFAAALMLKSEEKQLVYEEYDELKRLSADVTGRFTDYLSLKANLAEQANSVVSKHLLHEHQLNGLEAQVEQKAGNWVSTAQNGLSAASAPQREAVEKLFSESELLWNILAPPLLQDFANFYLSTQQGFTRIAPPNAILAEDPRFSGEQLHKLPILHSEQNPTREAVWSKVYFDPLWKQWIVSVLVPLYKQNQYVGLTGSDLRLQSLLNNFPRSSEQQGFIVFDRLGRVLAAPGIIPAASKTEQLQSYQQLPESLSKIIETALATKLPNLQSEFQLDDNWHLMHISHVDSLDWYVGIYKKRASAIAALEELKVKFFGLFILYAIFVAILLHQVLYQLVLRRINALVKAVNGFGRGQWDAPTLPHTDDEIGQLNASFNDMSVEIKDLVSGLNQRISEKEVAEKAANRLSKAVAFSGTGVVLTNEHFQIDYVNPKMQEMTGYDEAHFIGSPLLSIIAKDMAILVDDIDLDLRSRNYWRGDTMLAGDKDAPIWVSLSISPIREDSGTISSYVASAQDISFVKESQRKMEELAYYDTLTGLANRTYFRMQLRKSMALAERGHYAFALFYFDLDEFKRINDTLGHDAGDRLLLEVATRLQKRLRAEDTIARLGGDEFAVLLSGIQQREDAMEVANNIQATLSSPIKLGNNEVIVSASIGITMAPFDSQEEEQLLKHADLAMYQAKAKGRNTYHFYSQDLNEAANERLYIENELRQAIKEQQFSLYYQPQVNSQTGEVVGYEALTRWFHPTEGTIPPDKFIPIAEATGLIVELGAWVLEEACRFSERLKQAGKIANVSVNLSARQFKDAKLIDTLSAIIKETKMTPTQLHLELTESMLMGDVKAAITQLRDIKSLGVSLSIDDFGTGYSSLSYLKRFPVDVLKIDRSFVKDIPEDPNDMEITAAIIAMAQKLNLQVVAEGVETIEQIDFLANNNCFTLQGYYYSAPLQEADVMTFIVSSEQK